MGYITNKDFPQFTHLMNRVRAAIPQVTGPIKEIAAYWPVTGGLDIMVVLEQDAPTQRLQEFHPGYYTIHIVWDPYHGGCWGPGAWEVHDYESGEWVIPADLTNDAYLKPHQTPCTWDLPNCKVWDGTPLYAGANYRVVGVLS